MIDLPRSIVIWQRESMRALLAQQSTCHGDARVRATSDRVPKGSRAFDWSEFEGASANGPHHRCAYKEKGVGVRPPQAALPLRRGLKSEFADIAGGFLEAVFE